MKVGFGALTVGASIVGLAREDLGWKDKEVGHRGWLLMLHC